MMYSFIGLVIGGIFISLGLLIWGLLLASLCIDYVTEEKSKDYLAVKIASKLMAPLKYEATNRSDAFLAGGMCIAVGFTSFGLWPLIIIASVGYALLRTVRFAHRIKRSITTLTKNKKCLKDYKDDETPKMEF